MHWLLYNNIILSIGWSILNTGLSILSIDWCTDYKSIGCSILNIGWSILHEHWLLYTEHWYTHVLDLPRRAEYPFPPLSFALPTNFTRAQGLARETRILHWMVNTEHCWLVYWVLVHRLVYSEHWFGYTSCNNGFRLGIYGWVACSYTGWSSAGWAVCSLDLLLDWAPVAPGCKLSGPIINIDAVYCDLLNVTFCHRLYMLVSITCFSFSLSSYRHHY